MLPILPLVPLLRGWSAPARYLACALVAGSMGAASAWRVQAWRFAATAAEARQQADARALEAAREAARIESVRQLNIITAQHAQANRTRSLQADADSARTELDRLRSDLATTAGGGVPGGACSADAERAHALAQLLGQCAGVAADLAGKADRHASDAMMLLEAWPRD